MGVESLPPLLYRCPVCAEEIAVPSKMIGETVRCPREGCRQPVLVEPPRAEFLRVASADVETPALATQAPVDAERALVSLRPSMARSSPMQFTACWLGVLASTGLLVWSVTHGQAAAGWVSAAILVLLLIVLLTWWLDTIATSLTVTTRRTTLRRGIFEKNTNEVQHDDVRNIQVDQNVMHRLLGVGTLKVSSSGQDDLEIVVDGIVHPARVAQMIRANQ